MFSFDTILKKIGEIPDSVAKEETIKFLKIAYAKNMRKAFIMLSIRVNYRACGYL